MANHSHYNVLAKQCELQNTVGKIRHYRTA